MGPAAPPPLAISVRAPRPPHFRPPSSARSPRSLIDCAHQLVRMAIEISERAHAHGLRAHRAGHGPRARPVGARGGHGCGQRFEVDPRLHVRSGAWVEGWVDRPSTSRGRSEFSTGRWAGEIAAKPAEPSPVLAGALISPGSPACPQKLSHLGAALSPPRARAFWVPAALASVGPPVSGSAPSSRVVIAPRACGRETSGRRIEAASSRVTGKLADDRSKPGRPLDSTALAVSLYFGGGHYRTNEGPPVPHRSFLTGCGVAV